MGAMQGFLFICASIVLALVVAMIGPIIYDGFGNTPAIQPAVNAEFNAMGTLISLKTLGTWMPTIIIVGGLTGGFIQVLKPDKKEKLYTSNGRRIQ